jgi:hypothetical protein
MKNDNKPMPKLMMKKTVKPMPKKGNLVRVMKSELKVVPKVKGAKIDIKPMRRINLPEVTVTATRIKKPVDKKVRLMPKGEVSKKSVDSLKNIGYGRAIGNSYRERTGNMETYSPESSDIIKKALKGK